jgi:hypothetical protein
MDILIKSFNRPYYLERCLFSIQKYVKNNTGKIVVLDDGTPQIYLDKIAKLYPDIEIHKSEFYEEKQKLTVAGTQPNNYVIPINLWLNASKSATENFILLEDDTWFIEDVDVVQIENDVHDNNVLITKLFWLGNPKLNQNKEEVFYNNLVFLKPKLFSIIPFIYYFIFYKFNKYKIRKTLRFFKINTEERRLAYYTIYAVAGMIFNKNYYAKLWDNHSNNVDEGLQMFNAVKHYFRYKSANKYARYKHEILRTGFVSSATNQHKENYRGNIDMFVFNKILNESWYNDKLDALKSLPYDIEQQQIKSILEESKNELVGFSNWLLWYNDFKNEYKSIGCIID